MAEVMPGGAAMGGGAGGDGGDENRRPKKPPPEDYKLHMIDYNTGREWVEKAKLKDWATIGDNGGHIMVSLDRNGVPCGSEGAYLRQYLGKLIAQPNIVPMGVDDWHKV
ncbi:hypothetical protein LINPERHAP2_LOCUS20503, partial [Linum perenne]